MIVKFSTLAGGVWIEDNEEAYGSDRTGDERCFRFSKTGKAQYAILSHLLKDEKTATWQSINLMEKDFLFA